MKDEAELVEITAAGTPLQEHHAHLLFELCNGLGDSGLGEMALLRGSPHAVQLETFTAPIE